MSDLSAELVSKARTLPPEERARVAEELLESLSERATPEVEAEWEAEIGSRVSEVASGTATLVPAEEVFARVRKALG